MRSDDASLMSHLTSHITAVYSYYNMIDWLIDCHSALRAPSIPLIMSVVGVDVMNQSSPPTPNHHPSTSTPSLLSALSTTTTTPPLRSTTRAPINSNIIDGACVVSFRYVGCCCLTTLCCVFGACVGESVSLVVPSPLYSSLPIFKKRTMFLFAAYM